MALKSKLLFYFFCISILFIIVGSIFYLQLSNLIEPLTPRSIPLSVEKLATIKENSELKNKLIIQQLQLDFNLEKFLTTKKNIYLQRYYKNYYTFTHLLNAAHKVNPSQWANLETHFLNMQNTQAIIIENIKEGKSDTARELIEGSEYTLATKEYQNKLNMYFDTASTQYETAVITVKLATKNSHQILQKSLRTTLIIFLNAVLISIVLIIGSAQTLVQPINELRSNIENMDVEKLNLKINPVLLTQEDEIGDLARAFDKLFHNLREVTVLRDELIAEVKRHKKTEKQLRITASRLKESNIELDQFSYAASHDLRTPLRGIESLVSWIEEDCYAILPKNARKNFELIRSRVQRLDALINGMLEYSHAGRFSQEKEIVDLNALLKEIIDNLAPPPHIEITVDTDLPVLRVYKAKITQVFLNLINNAVKYNDKDKGFINIGHRRTDGFYEFYVSDNGVGIPTEFHQKIFEIFQTLHSRDEIEGSGIGLAIVKKIVEKHGGEVWLESITNVGTSFYFTWPIETKV
ncbi:sensory box histidine kinase (plasmid) [Legionella adelaidensis]|uniref:histidine kinase n=1 Tax=Legionella adelaidensis TaxID=45056 RepID=A0A0W0R1H0_9GAMM|nr:ATP-binding protein [Legionella adelaidensis]KTC64846.1 sensory box histidine kinase [Legionella adelaidensis]VEH82983.1 sensory box histidine kinase [Legionella adelaidensis]